MAQFGPAVELVMRHEGGFVNNPNDPGGATKYGITQGVLTKWRGKPVTPEDVRLLTTQEAVDIYRKRYWLQICGDQITDPYVAKWCLDMAVLRGVDGATRSMQQACGAKIDGVMGPKTLAAINAVTKPELFLNPFRSLCIKRFAAIVQARPASLEFLAGWVARAEEIAVDVSWLVQQRTAQAG